MAKKINHAMIGLFVVVSLVLMITGIIIFGSGKFFSEKLTFVAYFNSSLQGLNVGSPVVFRGVKVGSVTGIILHFDPDNLPVYIPVIFELTPGSIHTFEGEPSPYKNIDQLIEKGLKAQLNYQSVLTGQLMLSLDFYPNKKVRMIGLLPEYKEIPSVPTTLEELTRTISDLPIKKIITNLELTVAGIQKLVNSPDVNRTLQSFQKLTQNLNEQIVPVVESIGSFSASGSAAMSQAEKTLKDIQLLSGNLNKKSDQMSANINKTLEAGRSAMVQLETTLSMEEGVPGRLSETLLTSLSEVGHTLKQANETLASIEDTTKSDRTVYELNNALKELSTAARSFRLLVDFLEQRPESLIRGK